MKDVKFIALPMNFTTTPYMRFVVGEHGFQAVGRIIALIEMLNEMDNEYNLKDKMQKTILARGLKFDSETDFDKFIELVSTLPDFKIERHIFSSRYIAEAQDKIEEKSVKAKKNIAARWNKQKYDRNTTVCDADTTVLQENTTVSSCIEDEIRNDTYNNITDDNVTEKKIIKNNTPQPQQQTADEKEKDKEADDYIERLRLEKLGRGNEKMRLAQCNQLRICQRKL